MIRRRSSAARSDTRCRYPTLVRAHELALEPDARSNVALIDDASERLEDRGAVGDRLFMRPRFEDETERVHIAVRTDARITEKIPCAAKLFAALDEGEAMVGAIHLQMNGHAEDRKSTRLNSSH